MATPAPESPSRPSLCWARVQSFRHAGRGVLFMLRTQHNAWIHAILTLLVVALGIALGVAPHEWCWLVLAMASVWTAESFNTALETIVDMASPEYRPAAGQAKDVAAGAVLLCATGSVIVGLIIFLPRLARLLR
ncbi:diacylglycerol kinase family protein [bacterium]|nr:diacylglycerol kinase family protein [bacterium]